MTGQIVILGVFVADTAYRAERAPRMGDVPEVLQAKALEYGARLSERGRLCFPRALVEDIVAGAAKRFVFHGRPHDAPTPTSIPNPSSKLSRRKGSQV